MIEGGREEGKCGEGGRDEAALFPIQFLDIVPGNVVEGGPHAWAMPPIRESQWEFLAAGFSLLWIWLLWPLRKLSNGCKIFLPARLSLLPFK